MARILLIDDEENIRYSIKNSLDKRGYEVITAESLARGASFVAAGFDIILLDIFLPDGSGIDLLNSILKDNKNQAVVMISGNSDIDTAVKAIRMGAIDFIEKPISLERLLITIDNILKKNNLLDEKNRLQSRIYGEMIGKSESIVGLKKSISLSADKTSRFLIYGENGTGKELAAYLIHRCSNFSSGPFVPVNCAALPAELVEAELFGHTSSAFTGAKKERKGKFLEANHGSIFLDEISEMPLEAQAKILRIVETRQVTPVGSDKAKDIECNIIASTNKNLEEMVANNTFREDLLYRLNVVQYNIPPLRERKDDLKLLSDFWLRQFALETKTTIKALSQSAIKHLGQYDFPGNIRELKNMMERLNIYCSSSTILLYESFILLLVGV